MADRFEVEPRAVTAGLVQAIPARDVIAQEEALREAREVQASTTIGSLANYINTQWHYARDAKRDSANGVEQRMIKAQRARRGEYDPQKLAAIQQMGGSEVFTMITSVKCRAAASWIRDLIMGTGADRVWSLDPTPEPELSPEANEMMVRAASQPIAQATMQGEQVDDATVKELLRRMQDKIKAMAIEDARKASERMSIKVEDQLIEGGFYKALDDVVDDITTYPAAVMKGPVVRKTRQLTWTPLPGGQYAPQVEDKLQLKWYRCDPFDIFPSPTATNVSDGYILERHRLTRQDLHEMIGVDGYNDDAIRLVLDDHGQNGFKGWLTNDLEVEAVQGLSHSYENPEGTIDALQFWGSVQGKLLLEWGMPSTEVTDPLGEYQIEAWLIDSTVIKAVLNPDPLHRKPYFKVCYEDIPGSFWGNSVADLVEEPQEVCNAAARAIVNNMAMSSGPQVTVNVDRLAAGEELTTLTPWRIWQIANDPLGNGGSSRPIDFFQPNSNVDSLIKVFNKFSDMADEYSGIPKYLTGETTGGAGRTASGLSMLIGNAGKGIKQVISNIDNDMFIPMLDMLYRHNMMYATDPDLKGDIKVHAKGAASLIARETAQVRRNEFLAATANPIDMQVVGVEGRAELLRETAKGLHMDTDRIVPPPEVLRERMQAQAQAEMQAQGTPAKPTNNGQMLQDGSPIEDNF